MSENVQDVVEETPAEVEETPTEQTLGEKINDTSAELDGKELPAEEGFFPAPTDYFEKLGEDATAAAFGAIFDAWYAKAKEASDGLESYRTATDVATAQVETTDLPVAVKYRENREANRELNEQAEADLEEMLEAARKAHEEKWSELDASNAFNDELYDEAYKALFEELVSGVNTAELVAKYTKAYDKLVDIREMVRSGPRGDKSFKYSIPNPEQVVKGHTHTNTADKNKSAGWRPRFVKITVEKFDDNGTGTVSEVPSATNKDGKLTGPTFTELAHLVNVSTDLIKVKFGTAAGGRKDSKQEWEAVVSKDDASLSFDLGKPGAANYNKIKVWPTYK